MHPNPAFRTLSQAENIAFARARGFGQLSINGPAGPLAAHVPFVIDAAGESAALHLVRSNPVLAALDGPTPALLAVTGPDGYISPDWYGADDQVPTWNYVAVHLRGRLERRPDGALPALLDRLSDAFEHRLAPKPPWRAAKMDPEIRARMMRAVAPLHFVIAEVQGTWKLSQNKPDDLRHAAAEAVGQGIGQELAALAELMRAPPPGAPGADETLDRGAATP